MQPAAAASSGNTAFCVMMCHLLTDVEAARHAGQRLGHVGAHGRLLALDGLLGRQRLGQICARLLKQLRGRQETWGVG